MAFSQKNSMNLTRFCLNFSEEVMDHNVSQAALSESQSARWNFLLWTHHIFSLEHVVGLHIFSKSYPASEKIKCCGPPLCRIDFSVWSTLEWPAMVLKGCLLNQSPVHFLLKLIDWFSLDGQFWEGEQGAVFTPLFAGPHELQSIDHTAAMGRPNLGQLPCQQSLCWLLEGKTLREYNQETIRETSMGFISLFFSFYIKWTF